MKHCPKCQRTLVDEAKFCMHCGATIEEMPAKPVERFCINCGMEVSGSFCTNCGTPAGSAEPAPIPADEPVLVHNPEEAYLAPAPKKKGKGGLIAAIIAIVLVLGLAVSWAFGLFGDGGLFGEDGLLSSASDRDQDDDDDEDADKDDNDVDPDDDDSKNTEATEPVTTPPEPQSITLTVWAPMDDVADEHSWLWVMLEKFQEAHPEYWISWNVQACSESDAWYNMSNDVMNGADVYMYPNDQLGWLVEAGALMELGGDYLAQVKRDNSTTFVNTVTYTDGGVYGFPYTANTWFMYYDKSVFSESDIRSLEAMLEKGTVAFPLNNSWYIQAFYFANGCTMFGPNGNNASAGFDFGGDNAVAVTNYLVDLVKNRNFVCGDEWNNERDIRDGKIKAFMSGNWSADFARSVFGENMGVAPAPTITIDGEAKQLRSFAGSKAIGVNPYSNYPEAAMQLAAFLSSEEAQLAHYEMRGIIPAASALATHPMIAQDIVAVGESLTMQNSAAVQPSIPEMSYWWSPAQAFGNDIISGVVTHKNAEAKTKEFNEILNNG